MRSPLGKQEETMTRSKFNVDKDNSKRTYNDIVFDSILEMRFYKEVLLPKVESGEIIKYELQKPYELQPKFIHNGKTILPIKYVADFFIEYADGRQEVIDTKGYPDNVALIKRKMFFYHYPTIDYKWIKHVKKFGGWIEYDEYNRLKKEEKKNKSVR